MLSNRDEQVRILATNLMRKTGAPTITAAIRQALENETARVSENPTLQERLKPLRERVEKLRRDVLGDAAYDKPDPNYKDSRDDLWDR